MSAREELYAAVMSGGYHSPERSERASACIDAYRAEVLREVAESVRRWADANEKHLLEGERTGARMAANHINPYNTP
jgi:hypothetical protein